MKTITLVLVLCLLTSQSAVAGRLDIDPTAPDPAVTLAHGIIIPGGGWFYLNSQARESSYLTKGLLYLVGTLALAGLGASAITKENAAPPWPVYFAGLILIRFGDLTSSTKEAVKLQKRSQNF